MKIAIVTSNYPWRERPDYGAFVRALTWTFAKQGHECTVVAPSTIWDKLRFGKLGPRKEFEYVKNSSVSVEVLRPRIISCSAIRVGKFNSIDLSDYSFTQSVKRELNKIDKEFDLIYAHFFYPSGRAVAYYSRIYRIPYVVAHGDFEINSWYFEKGKEHFKDVAGVIAVSKNTASFCVKKFGIDRKKIEVFPNGVDRNLFYPRDRLEARKRLGLPKKAKIVVFVGRFADEKGPDRVVSAVEKVAGIYVILIGQGPIKIKSKRIIFQGVVEHDKIPLYLSAADLFVLPTTGEGSCNATIEAMACGLPVVSSVGNFNDDILNDDVSIRINPFDIDEIRNAIQLLIFNSKLREQMSENCLKWSCNFDIENRAKSISNWGNQKAMEWRKANLQ